MHKQQRAVLIPVLLVLLCRASAAADAESSRTASGTDALQLWQIQKVLASKKYVDLTHEFAPGIPRWPSFPDETRKIAAPGHETTDTDPGIAANKDDFSLETYILSTNHYQIELLTNLDQVPEAGAIALVSFPNPK